MFQLIKSSVPRHIPRDISRHWKSTVNAVKWVPASQHPVTCFWPVPGHGSGVSIGQRQFLAGEKEEFNSTGISCSLSAGQRTVLDMFNSLLQKKPEWSAPASAVHGSHGFVLNYVCVSRSLSQIKVQEPCLNPSYSSAFHCAWECGLYSFSICVKALLILLIISVAAIFSETMISENSYVLIHGRRNVTAQRNWQIRPRLLFLCSLCNNLSQVFYSLLVKIQCYRSIKWKHVFSLICIQSENRFTLIKSDNWMLYRESLKKEMKYPVKWH